MKGKPQSMTFFEYFTTTRAPKVTGRVDLKSIIDEEAIGRNALP